MNRAERHDTRDTPQSFGRYRIRGVLGEGGMGRLYVAEQTGIEGFAKIVALKRILPHLADSAPFRTLFLNEARVAARLEHPNIVATYELGEVDGTYFMSLEYLPGEDLSAVLSRCEAPNSMPVEVAALLAQQCANGLEYAHQLCDGEGRPSGLVHRDVNPSNIIVTYHGMVKLLDFGVVKAATGAKTSPGIFKGKYAYCAPEQLKGESVDHRTDVFSLGIVLWECLTGHRLFDSPTDAGTIDAVRSQPIVAPSLLRPEVPIQLEEITMRALLRDRDRRYQSAHELSEALDRFLGVQRHRPTSNSVGQWLEALFGSERASLKRAIAQGNDVEGALAKLNAETSVPVATASRSSLSLSAVRPRPLWSTSVERASPSGSQRRAPVTAFEIGAPPRSPSGAVAAVPPAIPLPAPATPERAPLGRRRMALIGVAVGLIMALAGGGLAVWRSGGGTAVSAPALGGIAIDSEPPGAPIIVDGDPSGFVTPAVLHDLRIGRMVEVVIDRAGYQRVARRIEVLAGEPRRESFRLTESSGTVRLDGIPRGATLYVDDAPTDGRRPLSLSLGSHRFRVEGSEDVLFSATIEVRAGEQTVRVRAEERGR
jgi:serine/threonine-protein kinase